jgi:hypothetical protein
MVEIDVYYAHFNVHLGRNSLTGGNIQREAPTDISQKNGQHGDTPRCQGGTFPRA